MDVREFFETVVPWGDGYITVHWKRPNQHWMGRSSRTIDDLLQLVKDLQADGEPKEIYFCISAQRTNSGQRFRDNVVALRCIPVDFDVDPNNPKKYASLEDAARGLAMLCHLLKLPLPSFIVRSGGGLHGYWVDHRDLTVAEWQPIANALKRAAQALKIRLDPAVTGDAVRILRVPGTFNNKYGAPRLVELAQSYEGTRYDLATVFEHVVAKYANYRRGDNVVPLKPVKVAEAFKHLDPNEQPLGEGVQGYREIPPLPFEPIKAECAWLRTAHETGGKDYDQGQWMLVALAATFLEDGYNLFHAMSDKYPKYTRQESDEMWERKSRERKEKNMGWPSCQAISDKGGQPHCSKCKHFPKAKSPVTIGWLAIQESEEAKELALLGGERPPELRLPEGFCREINPPHRICAIYHSREAKGNKPPIPGRLLWLISNQLRTPSLQFQKGHYGVGFVAQADRDSEIEIFLSSPNVAKANLLRTLLEKCVIYNPEAEAMTMVEKFAMSWLDKLRLEDKAVHDSGAMGWRYEDGKRTGFVCGDKFFSTNGTVVPLISSSDDTFRMWYRPVGSKAVWHKAAKLLTDRRRPELDCIIAVAFAAPLTVFAGTLYGAMLSIWGRPGTSKSTAQQVAAALWGHPKQTRESLNSTAKSVQGRLGRTKNLPAYWDDVQDERHQAALFDTMFVASEGAEGGRLNPDASYKERLEWQTLLVACSNLSFVEYLVNKQKSTTAGIRRVFEVEYNKQEDEPGLINQLKASQIFAELEHNYGVVGEEYAKLLATDHDNIAKLVADITNKFTATVIGTNEESFWTGMCGVLLAGATLARRLGVDIDIKALEAFLIHTYYANRGLRVEGATEGGSFEHTQSALCAFLNNYAGAGHYIYVDRGFVNNQTEVRMLAHPHPGRQIYIQVARETRVLSFSKRMFKQFLTVQKIDPRQVLQGLVRYFMATEGKITLGAGTCHSHAQEVCIEMVVPIGNEVLEQFIEAFGKKADEQARQERDAKAAVEKIIRRNNSPD